MKKSVVTYLIKNNQVCLGKKKFGYSEGKWNGFGGKVENEESESDAAARELFEESKVSAKPDTLKKVAHFIYYEPDGDWEVAVFLCTEFEGEPKETEEMLPKWFKLSEIPYSQMWENDKMWLNRILERDEFLEGQFWHDEEGRVIKHSLESVERL